MDWILVVAGTLLVILLAFVLGWTQSIKSTAAKTFIWIGAILLLMVVRFFDGQPFVFLALGLLALLDVFKHIPNQVVYTVGALAVGYAIWRGLLVIAENTDGIAREVERANARIALLDSSITERLRQIERRLPEQDEPEYLSELRKQTLRD